MFSTRSPLQRCHDYGLRHRSHIGAFVGTCLTALLVLAVPAAKAQAPLFLVNSETTVRGTAFKFTDTQTFSEGELRALIATRGPGFIDRVRRIIPFVSAPRYPLVPLEVQRDVVRLREFYRRNGFLETQIDYPASQLDTTRNTIRIIFTITEGRPLIIDTVSVRTPEGTFVRDLLQGRDRERWVQHLRSNIVRAGERFTQLDYAVAKGAMLDWIRDRGYAFATLRADSLVDREQSTIGLFITIDPGPFTRVDTVRVEGNESVREVVVRRESPLQIGSAFSQRKLLDGQRSLFRLGLFRVAVADLPEQPRDSTVTIRYTVREAKHRLVTAQTGYSLEDGILLQSDWTHRNFFGGARQFTVSGAWRTGIGAAPPDGEPIRRVNVSVSLRQPYLGSRQLSGIFSPFYLWEDDPNRASLYHEFGQTSTLLYEIHPFRTASLQYTFGRAYPLGPTRRIENQDIYNRSVVALSATLGKTNDFLNPRQGFLIRPLAEYSGGILGSGVQYSKLATEGVHYGRITDRIDYATRLYLGRLFPFGVSRNQNDPTVAYRFDRIRFYAGGSSDVRGWGQQQLGPRLLRADTTYVPRSGSTIGLPADSLFEVSRFRYDPVGGLSKVAANVELRLPMPFLGDQWKSAVFLDAGQVAEGTLVPRSLRFGTGAGIRYETPIGYVRLDIGYKINPAEEDLYSPEDLYRRRFLGEDPDPSFWRRFALHLSIGQAF